MDLRGYDGPPKWWIPDDDVFLEEIPMANIGKVSKKELRAKSEDYKLPSV